MTIYKDTFIVYKEDNKFVSGQQPQVLIYTYYYYCLYYTHTHLLEKYWLFQL